MIYDERSRMVLWDYVPNTKSRDDIVEAMKINLGEKEPDMVKEFSFSINDPDYEKTITGTGPYKTAFTYDLLADFTGDSESQARSWCNAHGVNVSFRGSGGYVVSQSLPANKRIDLISGSLVLTLSGSGYSDDEEEPVYTPPTDNTDDEDDTGSDVPVVPPSGGDSGTGSGGDGGNGSGKSTLLKTIMGYLPALAGTCEFGFHVTTAYFDQQFDTLDTNLTIYEDFKEKFPFKNDFEIRSALASFMFYPEDINKKIAVLSGGEKVRLALCEVVFSNANFLILDEPTNHLDILSKEKLEDILVHYPGTILFVSHDRYFIQKIADSILDFDGKNVTYYDYTYDDYLMKKKEREEPVRKIEKGTEKVKKENKKVSHSLDKQISKLEGEIEELKKELFLEEVYTNKEKYQEVEAKINDLEEKLNELLLHWD